MTVVVTHTYKCDKCLKENVPAAEIFAKHTAVVSGLNRTVTSAPANQKHFCKECAPEAFGVDGSVFETATPVAAATASTAPAVNTGKRGRGRPPRAVVAETAVPDAAPAADDESSADDAVISSEDDAAETVQHAAATEPDEDEETGEDPNDDEDDDSEDEADAPPIVKIKRKR